MPLSAFSKWTTHPIQPLSISHQGQFPAITISFNLAQGVALGQATDAIEHAQHDLNLPPTINTTFQGNAQAFQDSLSTVPVLILAALIVVYLILGVLYESYIHPITILSTLPSAGVGALLMLMLFHFDFSLIALIGIILLIGIVKKNGIMMIDFAIVAERDHGLSPLDAIRRAALLRFRPIMMTTMAAMLGGVPLMLGQGTGSEISPAFGLCHGRRPAGEPGADVVHHPGRVSLSRPVVGLDHRTKTVCRAHRDRQGRTGPARRVRPTKWAADRALHRGTR